MSSVHDVAAYIVDALQRVDTMKLQKLVYYSQAWHLVWEEEPLFDAPIEAWANGPVVYELFDNHRGSYSVSSWSRGNPSRLTPAEVETIDTVLNYYGEMTGAKLSALTHSERPWMNARRGLGPTDRSRQEIPLDDIAEFYSTLSTSNGGTPIDEIEWEES